MYLFEKAFWARAMRDPVVATGLMVDLAPVLGVLAFGWGAAPIVMLYWLENLVIGVFTVGRILLSGFMQARVPGVLGALFLCAFFTFHYGMFCMGHGVFLFSFLSDGPALTPDFGPGGLLEMAGMALHSASGLPFVLSLIIGWQAYVFVMDDWLAGGLVESNPMTEMFMPYGRIVVLHIGIFAGAFALMWIGDPMIGVLGLILLRVLFGLFLNVRRREISQEAAADTLK